MVTINELAGMIDHSLLRADATEKEFEKLCNEADINGFKMVAVNSYPVALCKQLLRNSPVHVGAAIGFPLGQTTINNKVNEVMDATENGADEIDNISRLKAGDQNIIDL